jgi:hypothetical protein
MFLVKWCVAYFKWITKWSIFAVVIVSAWLAIVISLFPNNDFFQTVNGIGTVTFFTFSALLGFVEIKLKIWPLAEGKNPNILEKIVLFVNSMLDRFSSGFNSGKKDVGGADSSSGIVDSFKKGQNIFGNSKYSSKASSVVKADTSTGKLINTIEDEKEFSQRNEPKESVTPIASSPAKVDSFKAKNVVAISGAVITWYEDGMMKYVKKCDTCSTVDQSEHYTQAPMPGSSLDTYFFCNKCRKDSKLIIKAV